MIGGHPKVLLLICVTLNIASIRSTDRAPKHFSPNFDPEYPHFTPFNNDEFVHISSDLRVKDEQPILPAKESHHTYHQHSAHVHTLTEKAPHPIKSFVMDLYQNYRSTYLNGNQTIGSMLGVTPYQIEEIIGANSVDETSATPQSGIVETTKKEKRRRNKVKRKSNSNSIVGGVDELKYNVGPGVNISMDTSKELVNVYLDEDCLKDVFSGKLNGYTLKTHFKSYLSSSWPQK